MAMSADRLAAAMADSMTQIMGNISAEQKAKVLEGCQPLAAAIIEEIKAHAVVTVAITNTDAGLQRVSGTPTEAPASTVFITGTIK